MSTTTTRILRRLQAAGFSQTEISRRAQIPQPTLSKWAAGRAAKAADAALRLREMELAEFGPAVRGGSARRVADQG
ncbi:helix-turn-helix domain-containing protein [Verminephrobacter aporrectodeae]|nr:helix-turn-helix domain-containing protein [Verminephrobacter aporrectodeae]